jgi:acetyltransferase-like isoleucine patch superfamily enzyme
MNKIIGEISVVKTLRFNFHYLKFRDAIRLPVIISRHVLINSMKGNVEFQCQVRSGTVRIGFSTVPVFDRYKSRAVWNVGGGRIIFRGRTVIGQGCRIGSGGTLVFGENFQVTAETTIICDESITFGREVLCSWQCQIMDTDFHQVITDGEARKITSPISIGDHVWIGSRVIINKGSEIAENSVIAASSVVAGKFSEPNTLLAGVPAAVKKTNINWR